MTQQADNVHQLHQPNPRAIREHLERLFHRPQHEYPEGRVEIAWSDPNGQVNSANSFPITPEGLDQAAQEAVRRNLQRRNVYVGPNPRKPETAPWGRAKAEEIERAYYQFADIDQPAGIARLREKLPLNYTMAVTTGRTPGPRVHPYWELDEAVTNMNAWRQQQIALADYFESDRVIDPGRVMRLAGTISYPPEKKAGAGYTIEPVTLRTVYDDDRDPVSSEAMFHAYPWSSRSYQDSGQNSGPESNAGPQPQPGADRFDTGRKDPREFVKNIAAGHNLHNNARDLVAHLVNTGHRDWLIRELLDRLLRPVSDGGTLGQIEELIRSARQKYNTTDPTPEEEENFNAPPPVDLYEPLDFEQLATLPPPSYLIDTLITDYGLAVIYGDPASGKTFLALDMALHLAYGACWWERETKQAGVLYIAGEGVRGIAKRIQAWRHHHGKQATEAPFLTLPLALDFLDSGNVQKLARTIEHIVAQRQFPLGLIVVDTVARNMNGDENDAKDMNKFVSAVDALRERFNVAVIGIHHCGKDHERGMRGSTALPGASDTIIEVSRDETVMKVTTRKQKDDEEAQPFYMEMVEVPTDPLSEQTSLVLKMMGPENPNGNGNGKSHNNPTHQQIDLIFDEIDRAWHAKNPWSCMPQTRQYGRYLPDWIAENIQTSFKQAQKWVEDWMMNDCLQLATCDTRTKQRGLRTVRRPGTSTGT